MAKVLVIDDSEPLLDYYGKILKDIGCEVLTTSLGEEGIRLAREHAPDCIMLDIMMSDMDGLDVLQELADFDSTIPVIVVTGMPSAESAIEALKRGAFDFLTKGCTVEEIIATARRALDRRRLYLENQELVAKLREANSRLEQQISEATEQVRELNNFNQSLLEGIDAGLLAASESGVILFANAAARRMLSLSPHQVIGSNLRDFGFEVTRAAHTVRRSETPHIVNGHFEDSLDSVEKKLERVQKRTTYRLPDGSVRVFGYSVSTTRDDDPTGSGRRSIVLFRDMTDMEELRNQMQRLQKLEALNVVVAGVAHEIKNPIAGIKSVASILVETMKEDDPLRDHVLRILEESRRVTRLVEEFFSFSRPSKPKLEAADVSDIIGRVVRLTHDAATQRRADIATVVALDIPRVPMDKDQIQQVILNLVLNALEAIGQNGRIEISADVVDYHVLGRRCARVQVRDSGPGFPADVFHRLFDPFFTTKPSGTGLGLHISQNIVLEHGGRIEAANRPDGGAVLSVYLPLEGPSPAAVAAA
ncbi:MAG TPA: response regulator [Candidatus Latescibacteria bacterium]|nr:response regulator [Candidatus Latescibacterota bacterium]